MSFDERMETYYQRFIDLQEKLRKSEEERLRLEMKFNEMVQMSREDEKAHYRKLRSQYKRFLDEDRKRQERNEKILRTLERIESRINLLTTKAERFKALRRQYRSYIHRISYREPPTQQLRSDDTYRYTEARDANQEKLELLERYLKSLNSHKSERNDNEPEKPPNYEDDLKKLDMFSNNLKQGFDSNKANSIAEDIMNSIYSRHYKRNETERKTKTKYSTVEKSSDNDEDDFNPRFQDDHSIAQQFERHVKINDRTNRKDNNGLCSAQNDKIEKCSPEFYNSTEKKVINNLSGESNLNNNGVKEISFNENALHENTERNESDKSSSSTHFFEEMEQNANTNEDNRQASTNEHAQKPNEVKYTGNEALEKSDAYLQNTNEVLQENGENNEQQQTDDQDHGSVEGYSQSEEMIRLNDHKDENDEQSKENNQQYRQVKSTYDENNEQQDGQQYVEDQHDFGQNDDVLQQQYDEQDNPLQYDNNGTLHSYDENGQPVIQYAEGASNIQQYDEPQYDENGQPVEQYAEGALDIQQYDGGMTTQDDQSIQQYNESQYDENGQLVEEYVEGAPNIQQYDGDMTIQDDQSIQQYNEPQYDENRQPVEQYAEGAPNIQQYDENEQPVQSYPDADLNSQQYMEQQYVGDQPQYDENGQCIQPYDQNAPYYDENGQPLYDENGQPIPYDDSTGQLVQYDENGQPIYDENAQYDQTNQPEEEQKEQFGEKVDSASAGGDKDENSKEFNVLDLLETDTETSAKENASKITNDSDFDFSNA